MQFEMNRRNFLHIGAVGAGALCVGTNRLVAGLPSPSRASTCRSDKVLVVIQMAGGNDGLNTVIPFENDDYHRARPTLRQKTHLKIIDGVGLSEHWAGIKALMDQGDLAVIQGVGYPTPNRSHFKSMDIWHSGDASSRPKKSGWLGRVAELVTAEERDPEFTINISPEPPLALVSGGYRPTSFSNPGLFRFAGRASQSRAYEKIASHAKGSTRNAVLDVLGRTAADARLSSQRIRQAATRYRTPIQYGNSRLGRQLRTVAALLDAGLSTRVLYVHHNGFDTHVNQVQRHARLLREFSVAVSAFQKDLARIDRADRVATLAFSEFGRRVKENGSRGTDHGTAGPTFVIGSLVKGGLLGKQPDLTDLDRGDLKFDTDFRHIYSTVASRWFGIEARLVLDGDFATLPLFEA